jgi:uncharacterized OB-fold protein
MPLLPDFATNAKRGKTRIPIDNICPQCGANNSELTSFPIASNESFTYSYNDRRGIEFEFKPRRKGK